MSEPSSYRGEDGLYYYAKGPNKGKPVEPLNVGVSMTSDFGVILPNLEASVKELENIEGSGYRLKDDWGARYLDDAPLPGSDEAAKFIGKDDYQQYRDAESLFEASIIKYFAGSQQSVQEAKRQAKAYLNSPTSSPESYRRKALARRRVVEAARRGLLKEPYDLKLILDEAENEVSKSYGGGLSEQEQEEKRQIEKMLGIQNGN